MSPFGIFSIVLIALYIIYYTVLIARDLHSQKGKGTGSDDEYEVTSMQQEVDTVGVEESAEGFTIGGQRKGPENSSVTAQHINRKMMIKEMMKEMNKKRMKETGCPMARREMRNSQRNQKEYKRKSSRPKKIWSDRPTRKRNLL